MSWLLTAGHKIALQGLYTLPWVAIDRVVWTEWHGIVIAESVGTCNISLVRVWVVLRMGQSEYGTTLPLCHFNVNECCKIKKESNKHLTYLPKSDTPVETKGYHWEIIWSEQYISVNKTVWNSPYQTINQCKSQQWNCHRQTCFVWIGNR